MQTHFVHGENGMDEVDTDKGAAAWALLSSLEVPGDAAIAERVPTRRHIRLRQVLLAYWTLEFVHKRTDACVVAAEHVHRLQSLSELKRRLPVLSEQPYRTSLAIAVQRSKSAQLSYDTAHIANTDICAHRRLQFWLPLPSSPTGSHRVLYRLVAAPNLRNPDCTVDRYVAPHP